MALYNAFLSNYKMNIIKLICNLFKKIVSMELRKFLTKCVISGHNILQMHFIINRVNKITNNGFWMQSLLDYHLGVILKPHIHLGGGGWKIVKNGYTIAKAAKAPCVLIATWFVYGPLLLLLVVLFVIRGPCIFQWPSI